MNNVDTNIISSAILDTSGGTITVGPINSFGTALFFASNGDVTWLGSGERFLYTYDSGSPDIRCRVGTASGLVITTFPEVIISAPGDRFDYASAELLETDKVLLVFRDNLTGIGYCTIITVSGTTPTGNTFYQFDPGFVAEVYCPAVISPTEFTLTYNITPGLPQTKAIPGVVTGTIITFGSAQFIVGWDAQENIRSWQFPTRTTIGITYNNGAGTDIQAIIATQDGLSLTLGPSLHAVHFLRTWR